MYRSEKCKQCSFFDQKFHFKSKNSFSNVLKLFSINFKYKQLDFCDINLLNCKIFNKNLFYMPQSVNLTRYYKNYLIIILRPSWTFFGNILRATYRYNLFRLIRRYNQLNHRRIYEQKSFVHYHRMPSCDHSFRHSCKYCKSKFNLIKNSTFRMGCSLKNFNEKY